jgi:hypothetical protein
MAITVINKTHSATKRGPGRVHAQGLKKAKLPRKSAAGIGFVQHTTHPIKNALRKARKATSARQQRKLIKAQRAESKKSAAMSNDRALMGAA